MSSSAPSPIPPPSEKSRPHPESALPASYAAIPGWMVSGMLHAGLIVFLLTSGLPSCGDGQIGTGADEGEFREVGIYVKDPAPLPITTETSKDDQSPKTESTNANQASASATQATDAIASDLIDVPQVSPRTVIGQSAGTPTPTGLPDVPEALVKSNAVRAPESQGEGPGVVSFMGQTTEAQSVVFVIDTSSSMEANNAIEYAKAKLKQSINGLNQKQEFQIISYNLITTVMRLRNDRTGTPPLYRATRPNLTLAASYISSLKATSGTKHGPALEQAFRYKPDVIFFLTDADSDYLSPKELSTIKTSWNKLGKTHIHCIHFGNGPNLKSGSANFLKTLASENRGSYSYFDVEQLESP